MSKILELKDKIVDSFKKENIIYTFIKILALSLFFVYMFQLFRDYAIDQKQIFSNAMTWFMLLLRWATILTAGYLVVSSFYVIKEHVTTGIVLGYITGILNLIFVKENFIAWGESVATPFRKVCFVLNQLIVIALATLWLIKMIKEKGFKNLRYSVLFIAIPLMALTFAYQPMYTIMFGSYGMKANDYNEAHIICLVITVLFLILSYVLMRNKTIEAKNYYFAALACSGVFNYFYKEIVNLSQLPLHLCNTAIVMMFLAYLFRIKGLFYFTYFVNVPGALLAMLMPDMTLDFFHPIIIHYWYNHIYAFALPILGVALHVYERPTLKMIGKAIFWFTVYFIIAICANAYISNFYNVDYFFINSDFFFEKLNIPTTMKSNYTYIIEGWDGLTFRVFPIFYIVVYVVYIGVMFGTWYIYDACYHISDAHYALMMKKKTKALNLVDFKKLMKGRSIEEPLMEDKKNMIEIKNFTKIYSGSTKPSVENLSLTIKGGEVYGFLGHNGAGKSTTIKSIVGIQSITSGQILIDGYDIEKQPVEAKLRIGYVSDNHAVYEKLTGREYINYIADLYMVSKEDRDERIKKYVEMFKLTDAFDREIKSYSHGMKQKIVVIASLIHDPKMWVLDEPLTGLDPTSAYEIKMCMREHADRGNIVFFSSHVIEVVEKICDRICIINHGHIVCEYSLKELKEKNISLEDLYLKYVTNRELN